MAKLLVIMALLVCVSAQGSNSSSTGDEGTNSTSSSSGVLLSSSTGTHKSNKSSSTGEASLSAGCYVEYANGGQVLAPSCYPPGATMNATTIAATYNRTNLMCDTFANSEQQGWQYFSLEGSPPICINLNARRKAIFFPTVDYYSVLQIDNSFNTTLNGDKLTWLMYPQFVFRLEVGGFATDWQYVWKQSEDLTTVYTLAYATAIIEVTDGYVTNVYWDTTCSTCSDDACIGGPDGAGGTTDGRFCGVDVTTCNYNDTVNGYYGNFTIGGVNTLFSVPEQAFAGGNDCDLSVYIGWTGTDGHGQFLTSSEETLSNFQSYSIAAAAESAAHTVTQNAPPAPSFSDVSNNNLPVPGTNDNESGP